MPGFVAVGHLAHQNGHGFAAHLLDRLTDAGQGRPAGTGDIRVVETDNGHVLGHALAGLGQDAERRGGHVVGTGEDAVDVGVVQEQPLHGHMGSVGPVVRDFLERWVECDPGAGQGVAVAEHSIDGARHVEVA